MPPPLSTEAPHLEYAEGDSIFLTIAEAKGGDFKNLATAGRRKMALDFHGLVPPLTNEGSKEQLLAVQITVFPDAGICIGFSLLQVVGDWRTFNNFLKKWSSLSKNGDVDRRVVAVHDRSVIKDPTGLGSTFLKEWWGIKNPCKGAHGSTSHWEMTRATFVLGTKEMEAIKKWIVTRSEMLFGSTHLLLSPYVLACGFVWVCWMKTHWPRNEEEEYDADDQNVVHYFGFIAGGMTRLPYVVPSTYAGNCVGFGRSSAMRNELTGQNGILFAAKAIGDTISNLNRDMLGGAKDWISEWEVLRESELHVTVTGSPKVELYGLDFGLGRPVKFEEISIDATGAISLCESREVVGGIEIGLALPNIKMDRFNTLFNDGLNHYSIVNDS